MNHDNKRLMQQIFEALAQGNGRPFVDAMADDFCWVIPGRSTWSRRWEGKQAVVSDLLRPLFERFADTYVNRAHRFIAEGEHVVVECSGEVTTKTGKRYDNDYCMVFRIVDGRLRQLTEYMDTELATAALGAP
ncbi:nuclear transport factor 2 family protein [Caldimonas brevitalea]|uniref:Ketosteroid isomerase n=1 Tax=Caldimonas brevitalea TaxID=413882 RepID=A0A0G3BGL1_9BURK|nr:nuclear transport factor 2 family protein [Caldimonas brevitalea]AKJ28579.1 ketosteroid isomerase [Caldimonas brevitalea]